jgi:protein TonB
MSEFVQWLTKNLRYPAAAQRNKQQGTVLVAFIINKDGTTTGHKVVRSAAPELDREALRVIKTMPKWKPGEDHGQPCRTYFCIPIVFKL